MVANPLTGKTVYVDSNVLIYAVETPELFPGLQTGFAQPLQRAELRVVSSWITLAEVLVRPVQRGDRTLEGYYRRLVSPAVFTMVEVNQSIADAAATLRAEFGLRLPDALHIATGQARGCELFLTRDLAWAKAGIYVVTPEELS
jgi:predicted nucleic acid-binding protein